MCPLSVRRVSPEITRLQFQRIDMQVRDVHVARLVNFRLWRAAVRTAPAPTCLIAPSGKPSLTSEDLMAMMSDIGGRTELGPVAAELETHLRDAQPFDSVRLAATFAGLLAVPGLQSNRLRLEALVHLSLAAGSRRREPDQTIVGRPFAEAGKGRLSNKEYRREGGSTS